MSSFVYSNYKRQLGNKIENLGVDTLKVALFTSTYVPSEAGDVAYQVNAPAAPTLTAGGTGGPGARTEFYKLTFVNPAGETIASAEASVTLTAGQVTTVTAPANPGGSCTGYNVYASTTSGGEQKQAGPIAFGTNWVEPAGGIITGAAPPGTNTAQIAGEVATGLGYTQGGIALAGVTWSQVAANSWADSWGASTTYTIGKIVRPATGNGSLYLCVQSGTSGSAAPTFGTVLNGLTVDNTVQWLNIGPAAAALVANNVTWTVTGVITFRYVVVYDSTTMDLVALIDPSATQTGPSSGSINVNWDAAGIVASV